MLLVVYEYPTVGTCHRSRRIRCGSWWTATDKLLRYSGREETIGLNTQVTSNGGLGQAYSGIMDWADSEYGLGRLNRDRTKFPNRIFSKNINFKLIFLFK